VQVYSDPAELGQSVGAYVVAGLETGAPAILIVTDAHRRLFEAELARRGHDLDALAADGAVTVFDADETLAQFLVDGAPDAGRFEAVVGTVVDAVAGRFPGKTIRAFGEMVDVLVQRGSVEAAIRLEELWNELAAPRDFALLCGYELDVFDPAVQSGTLPQVCRVHSHVRAVADGPRLAGAVDRALSDVLGPVEAARVYMSVAEDVPRGKVGRGQAVLMWLSAAQPLRARRVLARARAHYAAASA
jgi:hypothetical protein